MIIRSARREEADPIAATVIDQPLLQRYGTSRDDLAQQLAQAIDQVLVAEAANKIVGVAWFLSSGTLGLGGYLKLISVAPGCEGRGIGSALLDEVERRVREKSRHLFLLVSHFNDAAQRFYERRGYQRIGALPSLVKPEIDEILYWKNLPV